MSYHRSKSVLLGRADTEKKEMQEAGKKNLELSDKSKELLRQLKREDQKKKAGAAQVNGSASNKKEVSDDELQLQMLKKMLEISAYDSDHNGWIDENDAVFERLKIWTKDANGNDRLISLKDADVAPYILEMYRPSTISIYDKCHQ